MIVGDPLPSSKGALYSCCGDEKKKKSNSRYKDWRIGSGSEHYVVSHKKIMAVKRFLGLGEKMLGFDCEIGFCRLHAGFEELITNQTWI